MKFRILSGVAVALLVSTTVFGQASIAGKWQTDDVAAVQAGTAQARAGQTMILDLKLEGTKASGTLNELGNGDPLTIESGTVDMAAKTLTIVTQPRGVTWNIALTDDNTLTVTGRVFAAADGVGQVAVAAAVVERQVLVLPAEALLVLAPALLQRRVRELLLREVALPVPVVPAAEADKVAVVVAAAEVVVLPLRSLCIA